MTYNINHIYVYTIGGIMIEQIVKLNSEYLMIDLTQFNNDFKNTNRVNTKKS